MRSWISRILSVILAVGAASPALALDKVTFGTDWKAEAEHGGFYQAVATGIYAKHGLEVTIRQGGPQVNHSQLLAAGRLDFNMAPNSFLPFNFTKENVPMVTVAALFQKDPFVLISHPGTESLASLKGKTIFIGSDARVSVWQFLKSKFAFTDDQIKPYTFNPAPFLADKTSTQQGYLTSEPLTIEKEGKIKPVVFLLADQGLQSYGAMIQTSAKLAAEKPDLVQRFVDASIEGWYSYFYGDPSPANALIKKDNPEQNDELIGYAVATMKEYGIVDSGDTLQHGIGAMSDARWKEFFDTVVKAGIYPADMDYKKAYTLQFINKRVGIQLKK